MLNNPTIIIYLFIYFSILGWIIEVIYRSARSKHLINPGFLKGPYLPIYGFGGLLVLAGSTLLMSYSLSVRAIFYFIILTSLEFVTGVIMEKIFHIRLWDYSNQRFNLKGHVCFRFSIYWTLFAVGFDLSLNYIVSHITAFHEQFYPVPEIIFGIIAIAMIIEFSVGLVEKLKKHMCWVHDNEVLKRKFVSIAEPLLTHSKVVRLKDCNHHFGKTRLQHVLDVAWMAFRITKYLSLDDEATIRGALLHDLFYYDWLREGPRWHSIRHSGIALQNAQKVTSLSDKEQDIIKKHMWPLTVIPPRYAESWVVVFCDIYCSWRDYLAPIALSLIGKRKSWISKAGSRFPSYTVLKESYMPNSKVTTCLPGTNRIGNPLNILLINAQQRRLPFTVFKTLTLPRVAGATPDKHQVRIIDGRVEKIKIPPYGVDLVGITFSCNDAPLAYDIAKKAKDRGIKTIAGGTHATAVPDEILKHFDSVLVGEAEGGAWENALRDTERGLLKKRYFNTKPPDLSSLKPPRLDLLCSKLYLPIYPVEATRGCPNRCSFCFNRYIHPSYRKRPISHVVKDIKLSDCKNIFFMDDNLTADNKYAKELFIALRPLKKRLYFQMQLSAVEDEELVRLAAEAGCRSIFTGLESVNAASLDSVSKSFNQIEKYKEQIAVLDQYGIFVVGGLIFGLDGDNYEVFHQTLKFLNNSKVSSVAVNLVIPYPGTEFYAQMKNENRLLDLDYKNYIGYKLIVTPKSMSPEELKEGYEKFIKEFYSVKNIMGRFRNQHRSFQQLPLYIAVNFVFRLSRQIKSRSIRGYWD